MAVTSPQVGQVEIEPDTLWIKVKDVIRGAIQGRWTVTLHTLYMVRPSLGYPGTMKWQHFLETL